jgi:hypothetical protein
MVAAADGIGARLASSADNDNDGATLEGKAAVGAATADVAVETAASADAG